MCLSQFYSKQFIKFINEKHPIREWVDVTDKKDLLQIDVYNYLTDVMNKNNKYN